MKDAFIPIILLTVELVVFVLLVRTARKQGRTEAWALWAIAGPLGIIALLILWTKPKNIWGKMIRGTFWALLALILFSMIRLCRSLTMDEEANRYLRAEKAAEKAAHYRKPEVGDYACPHCSYVFGKDIPRTDPTFIMPETTTTCPGCGEKLSNQFRKR